MTLSTSAWRIGGAISSVPVRIDSLTSLRAASRCTSPLSTGLTGEGNAEFRRYVEESMRKLQDAVVEPCPLGKQMIDGQRAEPRVAACTAALLELLAFEEGVEELTHWRVRRLGSLASAAAGVRMTMRR